MRLQDTGLTAHPARPGATRSGYGPQAHTLEWSPVDHDGWPGLLRVTDHGAGSSEAELQVGTGGRHPEDDVRPVLERALEGLAGDVDQNFNVS
jgi:hypothetical protein